MNQDLVGSCYRPNGTEINFGRKKRVPPEIVCVRSVAHSKAFTGTMEWVARVDDHATKRIWGYLSLESLRVWIANGQFTLAAKVAWDQVLDVL